MNDAEQMRATEKSLFTSVKRRANKARNFPTGTDPSSRHAYIMADCMKQKAGYPMLTEEPWHCAISIMVTVALLWEARARIVALESEVERLGKHADMCTFGSLKRTCTNCRCHRKTLVIPEPSPAGRSNAPPEALAQIHEKD